MRWDFTTVYTLVYEILKYFTGMYLKGGCTRFEAENISCKLHNICLNSNLVLEEG